MSVAPTVVALGVVDARGVVGTGTPGADWLDLGVDPPGTGRTFRALFGVPDPTFRRLDRAARTLVLASEAAGLATALPADARDDTAVVVETERGCLDTDLRFVRGLQQGIVEGAVFPYTLASASLGEVALRHRLRGPALCLSLAAGQGGEALAEACRLIEEGEARFVLACRVEALADAHPGGSPALRSVAVLLASPQEGATAVAPWPAGVGDGFEVLAASLRS